MIRPLPLLAAMLAAGHAPAAAAGQAPVVAGRYDFATVSAEGTPLQGTIHLVERDGRLAGRVVTTIRSPLAVEAVTVDSLITVRAGGLALRWRPGPDSIVGQWRVSGGTGEFRGRRMPAAPDNRLDPVPCRVPGLGEVVRCGTLFVRENPDDAASRLIPLNLVVLPSETRPAAGALFHFAGGPGQAATAQADGNAERFAAIRRTRDIVLVDQRGTGESNGLYCDFRNVEERAAALFGSFFPEAVTRRCAADLSRRADLRFYHTEIAARDVDAVRAWLGHERIDLYGGSYGTRAALAYMRMFPARVRTATLRAVIAPSGSLSLDNARGAQRSLERLFADCAAHAGCAGAFPRLRADFDAALARVTAEPPAVRVLDPETRDSVTIAIDRGVFAGSVRRMLMDAELQRRLPLAIHEAAAGRFEAIRAGVERTVGIAGTLAWGMGLSVVCAEDPGIVRGRDIDRLTAGSFLGRWQVDGMLSVCAHWPAGRPSPGYDAPVRVDVPTLLLSGELDPTTPPEWGEEVAQSLTAGRHLVMSGVAHAPFPDCAVGIMARFVAAGSMDGVDTSCLAALRRAPFVLPR